MPTQSLNRDINYLSKDFDSIKSDLVDYVIREVAGESGVEIVTYLKNKKNISG